MTLSSEEYYERLKGVSPGLPERLKAFLAEIEPLGITADIKRTMTLKWKDPEGRTFPMGAVDRDGLLTTDVANWATSALGRIDLSHQYQAKLANFVPGASVRQTPDPKGWRVVLNGQNLPLAVLLDHKDAWIAAMEAFIGDLRSLEDSGA